MCCAQAKTAPSAQTEGASGRLFERGDLVRAAGEKRHENHEIGQREKPLVRLQTCRLRRASDKAEVAAFRKIMDVIHADASQGRDFCIGEDFLARFDGDHGQAPLLR